MGDAPSASFAPSEPAAIAGVWLDRLRAAFAAPEPGAAFARLLRPDAYLRDQVLFSWDVRTLHDPEAIAAFVDAGMAPGSGAPASGGLGEVSLDAREGLAPELLMADQPGGVQFAFKLENAAVRGRGSARVFAPTHDAPPEEWQAGNVFLMLDAIKGHEERGFEHGLHGEGGVRVPWAQVRRERRDKIEQDPYVIVVGAGQTGLQVAARLQQLGVPTIVLERNARVGDTWRQRYSSLTLHTPRQHHTLLYTSYPETWPIFTPKEKVGEWLEMYAMMQDLVVWTGTELTRDSQPTYDAEARRWTVSVSRNGKLISLRPAHVVIATGTLGAPRIPAVPNAAQFLGKVIHTSEYQDAAPFAGQRVLVVGSANTAADVAGDLVGAQATVTVLQRAPTVVALAGVLRVHFAITSPEGVPCELADFRNFSISNAQRETLIRAARRGAVDAGGDPDCNGEDDQRRKDGMRARGFLFTDGPRGVGLAGEINEKFAGHLVDAGFSDLVLADKITIKSGTEVARFTQSGVEFKDETALDVDAVIFATGYYDAREGWKAVFGDDVIERAGLAWGLDAEGEFHGQYRPTGHSGLWYAGGAFDHSRWMCKQLGLLIQARYLGLWKA